VPTRPASLHAQLRLLRGRRPFFGPGKHQLLQAIARSGSLTDAARALGMSYMRAWTLVRAMNREWRAPLVALRRGGDQRGGATLTAAGRAVLRDFDALVAATDRVARPLVRRLAARV